MREANPKVIKMFSKMRALLRRSEMESELDEELRYHIEQQAEQNIRLGMNPEEARLAALKAFGGVEQAKERSRDARGIRWLEEFWQDLRYGARTLMKRPGFTLIAVLTLGLGIGVNTALFTLFNTLIRPLLIKDPDAVVKLDYIGDKSNKFSFQDYLHFNNQFVGRFFRLSLQLFWRMREKSKEDRLAHGDNGATHLASCTE